MMKYDPILCMNVPETKTTDSELYKGGFYLYDKSRKIYVGENGYVTTIAAAKSFTSTMEAESYAKNRTDGKFVTVHDEDIALVKTVASKNGYAVHIVEGSHGQRVVLTFKGESYKNPHMWLGVANQSNINSAVEMMKKFAKSKDSKTADSLDRAILNCENSK